MVSSPISEQEERVEPQFVNACLHLNLLSLLLPLQACGDLVSLDDRLSFEVLKVDNESSDLPSRSTHVCYEAAQPYCFLLRLVPAVCVSLLDVVSEGNMQARQNVAA